MTHIKELNELTKDMWEWCENKNLWMHGSYIASEENVFVDAESRTLEPETEYELYEKWYA